MNSLSRIALALLLGSWPALALAQNIANSATVPAPRDASWLVAHEELLRRAQKGAVPVLFIGDSITQFWQTKSGGGDVWQERYKPLGAVNLGLAGDKLENILWRVQNGALGNLDPKVTVVLAGINNLKKNTPAEIASGIATLVRELERRLPRTRILLLGVFPTGRTAANPGRTSIKEINTLIAALHDGKRVTFLDIGDAFLNPDGSLRDGVMPDGLHPGPAGYLIWSDAMASTLSELSR